jgi:hypothetical protein
MPSEIQDGPAWRRHISVGVNFSVLDSSVALNIGREGFRERSGFHQCHGVLCDREGRDNAQMGGPHDGSHPRSPDKSRITKAGVLRNPTGDLNGRACCQGFDYSSDLSDMTGTTFPSLARNDASYRHHLMERFDPCTMQGFCIGHCWSVILP